MTHGRFIRKTTLDLRRVSQHVVPLPRYTSQAQSVGARKSRFTSEWRRTRQHVCAGRTRLQIVSSFQQTDDERKAPESGPAEYRQAYAPPPPPPPPPRKPKSSRGFPLWGFAVALLLAAGLWWSYLDSQIPDVYKDKDGMQYMLTKAGNQVMVGEDQEGRVYFIDKGGNFYYDSGDAEVGIYVVTADNKVYNMFEDGSGERQQVLVGSFEDLKSQKVKELGGIPVEKLRKAFGEAFDGTVTGFDVPALKGAPSTKDFGKGKVPKAIVEYEPEIVIEKEDKD